MSVGYAFSHARKGVGAQMHLHTSACALSWAKPTLTLPNRVLVPGRTSSAYTHRLVWAQWEAVASRIRKAFPRCLLGFWSSLLCSLTKHVCEFGSGPWGAACFPHTFLHHKDFVCTPASELIQHMAQNADHPRAQKQVPPRRSGYPRHSWKISFVLDCTAREAA